MGVVEGQAVANGPAGIALALVFYYHVAAVTGLIEKGEDLIVG